MPAVENEIIRRLPKGTTYTFHVTSVAEGQVERSSKPEAIALGVFGAIAALAALLIAGLAISRAVGAQGEELDAMRALGAGPLTLTWDAMLGTLAAVMLGAVVALGVAVALSPLAPIGPAGLVDPLSRSRLRLDGAGLGICSSRPRSGRPDRGTRLPHGRAPAARPTIGCHGAWVGDRQRGCTIGPSTRRQLAVTVAWQASVAAVVGVALGVPIGIALGRWLWDLFARAISAVPEPSVPVIEILAVALGALVLANLVAALPGRMAARTRTSLVLRAD